MNAREALEALTDPEVEAVDAWSRRLYPHRHGNDPLALAREATERKTVVKALREAAAAERELAKADAAAIAKAKAEAERAEAADVAEWTKRLFPGR